ncbi:MAG: hypothetical protein IKC26_10815 [Clostridia bacterium]|nr:hypothetical protein [Clostridia bacterium]MBR2908516.1 hypothetical protein [Clostridia bacterium]
MLIYKLLGALLLAGVGVYGSVTLNRHAKRQIERLDGWIALLRLTKNQIDCYALPTAEILLRCEGSLLERLGWEELAPPSDFASLRKAVRGMGLTEEGERIAENFCEEIGKGYRGEQLRTCDYGIGLFCAERDRLLAELPRRRQRNITLCMAASLGTVVVLL